MLKLTYAQRVFLELLPDATIFAWKSKAAGKIVDAFGPPENWTHHQIKSANRQAMITAEEHFALLDAGFTRACTITEAGRRALKATEDQT